MSRIYELGMGNRGFPCSLKQILVNMKSVSVLSSEESCHLLFSSKRLPLKPSSHPHFSFLQILVIFILCLLQLKT